MRRLGTRRWFCKRKRFGFVGFFLRLACFLPGNHRQNITTQVGAMGSGSRSRRREEALNAGLPDPEVDAGDAATVERRAHKARQRRRRTEERHAGVAEILSNLTMPPCDQGGAFGAVEDASAWRGGEPPIVDWSTMAVTCDPSTMAHDGNEAGFRGDTVGDSDPGTAYGKRYTDSKSVSGVGVGEKIEPARSQMSLRARRKRWQVESFALVLRELELARGVTADGTQDSHEIDHKTHKNTKTQPPLTVVDFGAGSGALILPLAHVFPSMNFVAVEMKRRSCDLLMKRASVASLHNVSVVCGMIEHFHEKFDVGVALHACGNATDHALIRCVRNGAHFAVSPCCIGKLKFSVKGGNSFGNENMDWGAGAAGAVTSLETATKQQQDTLITDTVTDHVLCPPVTITHPRSEWMRVQLSGEYDFAVLAAAADTGHAGDGHGAPRIEQLGRDAKVLVELDRAQGAREAGYEVVTVSLVQGKNAPPNKNHMLIGAPVGNARWLEGLRPL